MNINCFCSWIRGEEVKDSLSEADSREAQLEAETPHRWSLTGRSLTGRWWRNFMSRGPIRSIHYYPKTQPSVWTSTKHFWSFAEKTKQLTDSKKKRKKIMNWLHTAHRAYSKSLEAPRSKFEVFISSVLKAETWAPQTDICSSFCC